MREKENLTLLGNQHTEYCMDYDPSVLEAFQNKHPGNDYFVKFNCPEFTSLCPITGQPDFATIIISYVPDERLVESKSLKLYLFSFRNHGDFHEDCMNIIMKDLIKLMDPKYKRILLKLSGEGLMGDKSFGMSAEVIDALARQIKDVHDSGVEICVVVGGGNIFRGAKEASKGMNRTVADQVGMLATVMNALYVQSALEKIGVSARVMSGIHIPAVCEDYIYRRAARHLEKGRVIIFAGGTGNPYFTTDTGSSLRSRRRAAGIRDAVRRAFEGNTGRRRL